MRAGSRRAGGDMKKPARGPVIATEYWHRLEDGRVQCDVCPHFCTLREGQRGLCFVRAREGDQVVLTAYGRSSGFCVDPIEKKPLNHFLPGTAVLSFGTEGCNLSCKFCQNWDISKSREIAKLADEASPERIARGGEETRLPQRGVHLQRPDDLPRVRDRRGEGVPRDRRSNGRGHRRLHLRETARGLLPAHRRGQRGPEGLHREVLPGDHRRSSPAGARHARLPEEADERLARDHQPRHPGA